MDFFTNIWMNVSGFLQNVLPLSPFRGFINSLEAFPYWGYINWFIPVGDFLNILSLWLTAYGLYLGYSIILRWVKVSGS